MADPHKQRQTALAGIQAGTVAAAKTGLVAGTAVAAAMRFSTGFRRGIGPSGRAAFVVMPMIFTFWLRCEQHVVGKATGRRPNAITEFELGGCTGLPARKDPNRAVWPQ